MLTDGNGPATVVMVFPFAVDRMSVEPYLPSSATIEWTNDRTAEITIPERESFPGFKVPQARAVDGSAVVDVLVVALGWPPSFAVSLYTPAELLAKPSPPRTSAVRVHRVDGAVLSPDATKVLLYDQLAGNQTGPSPGLLELGTRKITILASPPASAGPFSHAGWVADRLVFVGHEIWVGQADGSRMQLVSDLRRLFGAPPSVAAVSPTANYVAVASAERIALVDLRDGSVRPLSEGIRSCEGVSITGDRFAWSADGRRLAWLDCGSTTSGTRVRIIDAMTGAALTTLDGGRGLTTMLTGDFAVSRESGERGAGSRELWVAYGFDGVEKARYLGRTPSLSPDGRYLLDWTCCAGEGSSITDLKSTDVQPIQFAGSASWLPDGRVLVLTH